MKKLFKLCFVIIIICCFAGCSNQGLSNRAIVKAMLIDLQEGLYKVSLVVLNCEPSSQIAEIKETASICTGTSFNLNTAILNAERQQNKSAFYAQNELLLINENAVIKFDEIINYFLSDNFARPGMTVYLTQTNEIGLKNAEKNLPKLINGFENINILNNSIVKTRVYDVVKNNKSYSAAFPILKINENEGSYIVENMAVVSNNNISAKLKENDLALAILLCKRSDELSIITEKLNFQANSIRISCEVVDEALRCTISGRIKQYETTQDVESVEKTINDYIADKCNVVFNNYFKENDILKYNWWLDMYSKQESTKVSFVSNLVL